jgi:hypothetical protein
VLSLKTLLTGERTIPDVEKAIVRANRELRVAEGAVHDAAVAYDVALEDGEDDTAMRAALDLKHTTGWQVNRLTKRIAALNEQLAKLKAEARSALLAKLRRELLDVCVTHGDTAAAATSTAARVVSARMALERAGFTRELSEIEMFPAHLVDVSQLSAHDPQVGQNDALDRWRHRVNQLKASLEIAQ